MVVPYLLSSGRSVDADIPMALADVQLKMPGIRWVAGWMGSCAGAEEREAPGSRDAQPSVRASAGSVSGMQVCTCGVAANASVDSEVSQVLAAAGCSLRSPRSLPPSCPPLCTPSPPPLNCRCVISETIDIQSLLAQQIENSVKVSPRLPACMPACLPACPPARPACRCPLPHHVAFPAAGCGREAARNAC